MPFTDPEPTSSQAREYDGNGYRGPGTTQRPAPFRLQTAQNVIDVLQEQVEAVRADVEASAVEKARVIGQLASITLKAIEADNVAARLEALEVVLKQREGNGEP